MKQSMDGGFTERKHLWTVGLIAFVLLIVILVLDVDQMRTDAVQTLKIDHLTRLIGEQRLMLFPPPSPTPMKERRLPACLIIGGRKCGTRALLDALALHPLIAVARYEVHFFDTNDTYQRSLDWYRAQMPESAHDQLTIEKTPAYFTNKATPERVYEWNKEVKLILIVRNPVTRTISDFTQVHYTRASRNKSLPVFSSSAFDHEGQLRLSYKPVLNSLFSVHLRSWLRYFPQRQMLIVDGDNFIRRPLEEVRRVERFLRLPAAVQPSQMHFNRTKGFYCFHHSKDNNQGGNDRCLGPTKGREHVRIPFALKRSLREQLAPHNEDFFRLIGRRFDW